MPCWFFTDVLIDNPVCTGPVERVATSRFLIHISEQPWGFLVMFKKGFMKHTTKSSFFYSCAKEGSMQANPSMAKGDLDQLQP